MTKLIAPVVLLSLCVAARAGDWNPLGQAQQRGQFQSSIAHVEWSRPPRPKEAQAPASPRTAAAVEKEATAIALRLGMTSDSTYEADPTAVQEFVGVLNDLRSRYPEVDTLDIGVPMGTSLIVSLTPDAQKAVAAANPIAQGDWHAEAAPQALGLSELDQAVSSLGGSYRVSVYKQGDVMVVVELGRELDLAKILKRLSSLPGVRGMGSNMLLIGGAGMPKVEKGSAGEWRITLTHGWGDCMAGCIYREAWYFENAGGKTTWKGYVGYGYDTVNKKMVPVEAEPPAAANP